MRVLVIIVSYNFERWLQPCLSSLRQSNMPVDVLVIDNASQDHTIDRIRTEFPEVRLLRNRTNLGFGQANNLGIQMAIDEGYEAVFLMNQDAWISPDCLSTLAQISQQHPEYGILSPTHLKGHGDGLDTGFAAYCGLSGMPLGQKEIVEVPFINAAFWFIPLSVIKRVGVFSPLFYHYGEDKDYVNRLTYHHFKIGYSPHVFGWHDREDRILTDNAFLRSERVYLLSEFCNLNYSLNKAFALSVLACIKKAFLALGQGKSRFFLSFITMTWELLKLSPEVYKTRKMNSQ